MRALGISCTPKAAYLTLADDGEVVEAAVMKIDVSAQYEASAELLATLGDIERAYAVLQPEVVGLLKPEKSQRGMAYETLAPRVSLETLTRIGAVQQDIHIEVLARQTVRARLGLPKSNDLVSHVPLRIPEPVGPYWTAGRGIAGLAALALDEEQP